jgi:DNA-binding response OmpR family regulator
MNLKVLALGSQPVTRWVSDALWDKGGEVDEVSVLTDSSANIKAAKYDVAVIDSSYADLESICFKMIWYFRVRVAIVTANTTRDWSEYKMLGVDAFIPPTIMGSELVADLETLARKGPPIFPKIKTLLIEDDAHIRDAVRFFLRIYWPEIELHLANDGRSGIDMLKANPPDLVLLDLGLPDISGYEVMTQVRSFSQVPIIILTAMMDREYIIKAIQNGANDYVVKPFKQPDLLCRIKKQVLPLLDKSDNSTFRFFF